MVDHTFVICAYKQSKYLEDCILSIMQQEILGNVIMVTSTKNDFIEKLSIKYNIPLYVNSNKSSIYGDWNFGVSKVKTNYFTIAHQDDIYHKDYLKKAQKFFEKSKTPLIFFSGYSELRNNHEEVSSVLLNIKRIMLFPLKFSFFSSNKWIRRRILSFGNPICCPAVSFCKNNLPKIIFSDRFQCDLDWFAWECISKLDGDFLYCPESLMSHRIHEESTTTKLIVNNVRSQEDYEMFRMFWPKPIATLLAKVYSKSLTSNDV